MLEEGRPAVFKRVSFNILYRAVYMVSGVRGMSHDEFMEIASTLSKKLMERGDFIMRVSLDPVPEVNRHNIDKVLEENKVVFLFFTAEWCGPCISFLQTFREVAIKAQKPGVYFGRVDVDRSYTIADRYSINHIPSILIIVDKRVVDSIVGSMSRDSLEAKVRGYIDKYLG